jgi:hypothetical protein
LPENWKKANFSGKNVEIFEGVMQKFGRCRNVDLNEKPQYHEIPCVLGSLLPCRSGRIPA